MISFVSHSLLLLSILGTGYGLYFSQHEKNIIVQEHNALRRQEYAANMQEMVWNEDLARMSAEAVLRCNASHTEWHTREHRAGFAYSGESIFWATNHWEIGAVVRNLHDEKPYYDYASNTCHLRPGALLTECGHYTQIVWAKSCSVGCAYVPHCNHIYNGGKIKRGFMVVCKYGPGLDYNPMPRPFIKGAPCTQCGSTEANARCQRNHGLCPTKCLQNTECVDYDRQKCQDYARKGLCQKHFDYTSKYCKRSCRINGCL